MIVYEVRLHIPYNAHVSHGFFLRKTSAEEMLESLKNKMNKRYINDYYIEEHEVSVE